MCEIDKNDMAKTILKYGFNKLIKLTYNFQNIIIEGLINDAYETYLNLDISDDDLHNEYYAVLILLKKIYCFDIDDLICMKQFMNLPKIINAKYKNGFYIWEFNEEQYLEIGNFNQPSYIQLENNNIIWQNPEEYNFIY